jgi:hypothetical protein
MENEDIELDDYITKESIEEQAMEEVKSYKNPLHALITARMLKNKGDKMADIVMSKAVAALKDTPRGKFEWMGVSVSLVKGRMGDWFAKSLDEVITSEILNTDMDFTEETLELKKEEVTEGYNDITGELFHLENLLFEIEQFRDKKIAEIQKLYEVDIALAKRSIDEKKTEMLRGGMADVLIGEPSAKVNFPSI